jgi:hypothetical protein
MSSHKEAPGIVNDAAADNTDVYAFVSPDKPTLVTLIANFVPLEDPAGGPNFFEFGDNVLYQIHIDNTGDGVPDVTYQFTFTTSYQNLNTFLYNTGPIASLTDPNWNRRQTYSVAKVVGPDPVGVTLGTGLPCPPCNIGPASTPNYATLANTAIKTLATGEIVFAGQRAEGFYVDLGAIFDLGDLRPFQADFLNKMPTAPGINTLLAKNINSIAIQVPITDLTVGGVTPTAVASPNATIGVWATASRHTTQVFDPTTGLTSGMGPFVQISREGNPLVNEVIIPMGKKDLFNSQQPSGDTQFATYVDHPELAGLLPVLYPGVFPNLAALDAAGTARGDLDAVLLTGIPAGLIAGFQNVIGAVQPPNAVKADMLRLNVAIPPTAVPSNLGLVGGDPAGFPNGRRVFDDVTTIELRAIAGAIYPLVAPTYTADAAAGAITPGLTSSNTDVTAENTVHYLTVFPYLGVPHDGYHNPSSNAPAPDLGPAAATGGTVPVGAPNTGLGPGGSGANTGLLVAGGAALVGAAIGGGALARQRKVAGATGPGAVAIADEPDLEDPTDTSSEH